MASDSYDSQLSTFSQQGTVDWVALSNMQFSASVAVLSRLAAAGIDSLTVAFGQAMCCKIPIGVHGEKVLGDAMKKLVAFSSFGNLVWFGIGVRHILRDLVQTSQGSALVALCGALSEGYSADVSALVLYELAKLTGGPRELMPSFAQWKALMEVSGSVFNTSTLGLRIGQLTNLDKSSKKLRLSPSHPSDLARVILAVGKVMNGELVQVSIQGGTSCSWVAAWADFLLGLRVKVSSKLGETLFVNYDHHKYDAQVIVEYMKEDMPSSDIWCIGHTLVVRSGADFIDECFGYRLGSGPQYLGGRVDFSTMLLDCFGADFLDLVPENSGRELSLVPTYSSSNSEVPLAELPLTFHFSSMMALGFAILARCKSVTHRFNDLSSYVVWTIQRMPELQRQRGTLLKAVHELGDLDKFEHRMIGDKYEERVEILQTFCLCERCYDFLGRKPTFAHLRKRPQNRVYCLVGIVETILALSFYLNCIVLESELLPVRCGVIAMYKVFSSRSYDSATRIMDQVMGRSLNGSQGRLALHTNVFGWNGSTGMDFSFCALLFSGVNLKSSLPHQKSAMTNGKLYWYLETLRGLTDCPGHTSTIHVGSGTIQYLSRYYREISDKTKPPGEPPMSPCYAARSTSTVSDIALLSRDTGTAQFEVKAAVEEKAGKLFFWYNISSAAGETIISPALVTRKMFEATEYLRSVIRPQKFPKVRTRLIQAGTYTLVEGEGAVERAKNRHILRPLRSNMLGRLVALYYSQGFVALVKSDRELQMLARYWAGLFDVNKNHYMSKNHYVDTDHDMDIDHDKNTDHDEEIGQNPCYCTLIS